MPTSPPRSSNFEFLRTHAPLLVTLAAQAERCFAEDPITCLMMNLRQFSEHLAQLARPALLLPLIVVFSGCSADVTGRIEPAHFQFTTTVPQRKPGPGGWRVACVHAQIKNGDTGEMYTCPFGVEMPIETNNGPISTTLAQRVSADCANDAAYAVLSVLVAPPPPLYTLCTSVRTAFNVRLKAAIRGAQVMATCHALAKPVVFGIPTPKI